jgi:hypothetical protein
MSAPAEPSVLVAAPPGTPARVMNAGTALSREVAQELAAVVEQTFRRERLRRRATVIAMPTIVAIYAFYLWATNWAHVEGEAVIVVVSVALAGPLALHLLWGARNRALLDVAADDGAISRAMLVDAVQRMQRDRVGPSTALRDAQIARRTA